MSIFNKVAIGNRIPKNVFDLSREYKTTVDFGYLYPIFLEEILPGDYFSISTDLMLRFMPLVSPVYHRMKAYIHYFFVQNANIFDDWRLFITGGDDGTDTTVFPVITVNSITESDLLRKGTLANYFGIPPVPSGESFDGGETHYLNALPFRAYQFIYNEYYRDQDLVDPIDFSKSEGIQGNTETSLIAELQKRAYAKDYFTSARPDTQKGTEIEISGSFSPSYLTTALANNGLLGAGAMAATGAGADMNVTVNSQTASIKNLDDPQSVDMGTINNLRTQMAIQGFLEKMQRGGSRYTEVIRNWFDETPDDYSMHRPIYLGGHVQNVVISEVLNTSDTANADQGAMAGHGISVGGGNCVNQKFRDHGFIMGILSLMPESNYMNGLHKLWKRNDRYDFYWSDFEGIGEQAVLNEELFWDTWDDPSENENTFGHQERFSEYKYGVSLVTGEFRDDLDYWTLSRNFASLPLLNETFLTTDNSADGTARIFAYQIGDHDKILVQAYHRVKASRKMNYHTIPNLI